jgi:two-component system, NarL family, nitrate/nitrite response regulator NarL
VLDCAKGLDVLPAAIAGGLAQEIRRRAEPPPTCSVHERQLVDLIASGRNIPIIAAEPYLAPSTVKTHVRWLSEKLGVADRAAVPSRR